MAARRRRELSRYPFRLAGGSGSAGTHYGRSPPLLQSDCQLNGGLAGSMPQSGRGLSSDGSPSGPGMEENLATDSVLARHIAVSAMASRRD
jgi:hypothetical protein